MPELQPRRVVAVGVALYALVFSFVAVTRHLTFRTHALDLGYYVQLTWNLAQGHGPYVSLPEMQTWGDHLSPIVYLFVPMAWLMPIAPVLLVGQSELLALGALPVLGIARQRLQDERPAAAFAILYLLNPSLHGINVRDFHAAALAIPLLLAAIYLAEVGRPWLFVLATVLTLMCREGAALPVMGLGVWLALSRHRWHRSSIATAPSTRLMGFPGYVGPSRIYPRLPSRNLSNQSIDAVVDFDRALRDPAHPTRMLPIYDCGDHLHPSDLGYNTMGDALDLALFD